MNDSEDRVRFLESEVKAQQQLIAALRAELSVVSEHRDRLIEKLPRAERIRFHDEFFPESLGAE